MKKFTNKIITSALIIGMFFSTNIVQVIAQSSTNSATTTNVITEEVDASKEINEVLMLINYINKEKNKISNATLSNEATNLISSEVNSIDTEINSKSIVTDNYTINITGNFTDPGFDYLDKNGVAIDPTILLEESKKANNELKVKLDGYEEKLEKVYENITTFNKIEFEFNGITKSLNDINFIISGATNILHIDALNKVYEVLIKNIEDTYNNFNLNKSIKTLNYEVRFNGTALEYYMLDGTVITDVVVKENVITELVSELEKYNEELASCKKVINFIKNNELKNIDNYIINEEIPQVKQTINNVLIEQKLVDDVLAKVNDTNFMEELNKVYELITLFYQNNPSVDDLKTMLTDMNTLRSDVLTKYNINYDDILSKLDISKIVYYNNKADISGAIDKFEVDIASKDYRNFKKFMNIYATLYVKTNKLDESIKKYKEEREVLNTNFVNFETLYNTYNTLPKLEEEATLSSFYVGANKLVNDNFSKFQEEYNNINKDYTNEIDRISVNNQLNNIKGNLDYILSFNKFLFVTNNNLSNLEEEFNTLLSKTTISIDNSLASLVINGVVLDVNKLYQTMSVEFDITKLDIEATTNNKYATVKIIKDESLVVGLNTVKVIVTAQNGETKEYVVDVIRNEQVVEEEENKEIVFDNNNNNEKPKVEEDKSDEVVDDKFDDKYTTELDDNKTSPLTIALIVIGIGLIAFGAYLLFGDKSTNIVKVKKTKTKVEPKIEVKEDVKPKNNTSTKTNKKPNTSNKKYKRK